MTSRMLWMAVLALAVAASAAAQESIPVGTRVGSGVAPAPAGGYDDAGRRDPFLSLVMPKKPAGTTAPAKPATGLAALTVSDAVVTAIVKGGGEPIALLLGPDGKSFMTRAGDKLHDGVVKRIDPDAVIFVQQVEDVLGVLRPKDVRKTLRTGGEGR